jgi:hypothetical protein
MFAFTFIVNLVILIWSISRWVELKVVLWRSVWVVPLVLYLAILLGCIFLFLRIQKGGADRLVAALELEPFEGVFWRAAGVALFAVILWAIPWLKFSFRVGEEVKKSTQDPVLTMIVFYWVVWWLVLLATAALKVAFKTSWPGGFAAALVLLGIAYEIFIRAQAVSTYPFSLGWSESSRFYYGSLFFARSIYGTPLPLSPLHPSRYFLQSLPFLFPGSDLVASRLWQFVLWIGLTGVGAFALAWRTLTPSPLSQRERGWGEGGLHWLLAGWLFLFLLRVGVYYHLEPMVIIPVLFVSTKHPSPGKHWGLWRSLAAVAFASAWAGVSRVNWFPVPAMLAVAIYLLEEPFHHDPLSGGSVTKPQHLHRTAFGAVQVSHQEKLRDLVTSWLRYLKLPLIWAIVGLLTALAAQAAYIPLSGNADNAGAFGSSFSSDLLWDRLWPNDSFPLGVLPAILIISGPLLVVLIKSRLGQLHPVRWLGLLSMLAMLFVGGLVVSVKIGGGGDLHNMDAYAVFVSLLAFYCIGGKAQGEALTQPNSLAAETESGRKWGERGGWPVTALALLIPLVFLVPALSPFPKLDDKANQAAFTQLKTLSEQAGRKGPVLFINERHLVTFHQVNVPLVPDYEAVTLMEMAMSNNQVYLRQFYADLKNHRFAAIVAGKQNVGLKEEGEFADENNVWNARVSPYILCYYEPTTQIETNKSKIEFYTPRTEPGICPE